MNALDQLNVYLQRIEKRLKWFAFSRGSALTAVAALVVTVLLVLVMNQFAFSHNSVAVSRFLLFLAIGGALAFGLLIPWLRANRRNATRSAERQFPEFQERLLTLAEKPNPQDPFVQLLANDTLNIARSSRPEELAPGGRMFGFIGSAGAAFAVLLWLILAGPGYLGYGSSLLWAGAPRTGGHAFYDILVSPGDRTVRRKADQLITAQLFGLDTTKVRLFAQYHGTSKWEPVLMQPSPHANTFEFLFGGLADSVEYYVDAGPVQSKHYRLKVVDLPGVQKIRVTYHFPAWSGMQDATEDPGGDLRAVEGTEAEVSVLTDRPLSKGLLVLGDDRQVTLTPKEGNWLTARVPIDKDGLYHIAALEGGESVRLSDDYFIEARKDTPPTVKMNRPGRDFKATPIEEVPVEVSADDDFGLTEMTLHYAVNGGAEKTINLLSQRGVKSANGKYTLALEDFKIVPGDVVSLYASAKDARTPVKTDIYFIEAQPFERNYSQAQAGGGGQGGDQDGSDLSQRQKEIIAATWNEQKNGAKDPRASSDDARFLNDVQGKLGAQAKSLAERMRARQLAEQNPQFQTFSQEMDAASAAAAKAAEKLKNQKWTEALVPQQQALQHILRAESVFRDIQVARGAQGGQGAGSAGRDLENLADLELDREKNQYETGQQSASDQKQKQIDDAMQKLADLAKRQQELASRKQQPEDAFRQRWEQEMLRREAEELKKQMEQMAQQQQQANSQQQSSSQSSSSSSSQSSSPSSSQGSKSSRSQMDPRIQQALEHLAQAAEDMRKAASPQNGSEQTNAGQRRAAERLNEARGLLGGMRNQQASQELEQMKQQAEQLAKHQEDFQNRLRDMYANQPLPAPTPQFGGRSQRRREGEPWTPPGPTSPATEKLAAEKERMAAELHRLQQQMADTARGLRDSQAQTSQKLREALSEAEQNDIEVRMKKGAEWIRQGQGVYTWVRESSVTQGLDKLREQMKDAQASLRPEDNGKGGGGDKAELERALAQVEAMRGRMEQAARGQQAGQQAGQQRGQQGQPGQQAGQQPGQQPGRQPGQQAGQAGQPGQRGEAGSFSREGGSLPSGGPAIGEQAVRETMRDLSQLRQSMQGQGESDIGADVMNVMRALQGLNYTNEAELSGRLNRQVIPQLERLELELRRQLDEKGDQVRSSGSDIVPAGFADSVAEYFRRLSKGK